MQATLFGSPQVEPATGWTILSSPYDYQASDHDEHFRLADGGCPGTLTRCFTGGGKTYMSCLKARTWLNRGPKNYCMVVSYEKQLVWQFAQEIEDFLAITPGIEMEKETVNPDKMPRVIVASRQSLLIHAAAEPEQIAELAVFGVKNIGACTKERCAKYIRYLRKGVSVDVILEDIESFNLQPEVHGGVYSRVRKFDWRLNWLIFFDEAHRHAHSLTSVGHIVDWFDQNPISKRSGMTATPKLSKGISLGHKMFPGICLDYPLFHLKKPCAVKDGYAVPYVQKYIEVEGVDFKNIKKIAGDFSDDDLERVLGAEAVLAKLVNPLLDLVGDRKTLIFSPGVDMAKNVARYINARSEATCPICTVRKWYPSKLIGDGAICPCGRLIDPRDVTKSGEHAHAIWGEVPTKDRKTIYQGHQDGTFQFLSVCGLCREGYNDPDIACVAVFRPVSKKASSTAEQMKGRACRVLRGLIRGLSTREERLAAIASSSKPNALIVDLVGITGLADCASTVQIYAEGVEDEVVALAEKTISEKGLDDEQDVEEVIANAQAEIEEERAKIKQEREEAERRAQEEVEKRSKADAEVKYTTHDVGIGGTGEKNMASPGQLKFMAFIGMEVRTPLTYKKAKQIIDQLRVRRDRQEIAMEIGLDASQWNEKNISGKQRSFMAWKQVPIGGAITPYDANQRIDAKTKPAEYESKKRDELSKVRNDKQLDAIGLDLTMVRDLLRGDVWQRLVDAGKAARVALSHPQNAF